MKKKLYQIIKKNIPKKGWLIYIIKSMDEWNIKDDVHDAKPLINQQISYKLCFPHRIFHFPSYSMK